MLGIPNKKMPKCCWECPCEQESHCGAKNGESIDYDKKPEKQRMPWCPLVEIDDSHLKVTYTHQYTLVCNGGGRE